MFLYIDKGAIKRPCLEFLCSGKGVTGVINSRYKYVGFYTTMLVAPNNRLEILDNLLLDLVFVRV